MTIASKLDTINSALSDIKSAIALKGGDVSGNITTYSTEIENLPTSGGGYTITATNSSSKAVQTNDEVWMNKAANGYKIVDFYNSLENFSRFGSVTIQNMVASNFSISNYLMLSKAFNPGNDKWEIKLKFTTSTIPSQTDQEIFHSKPSSSRYGIGLWLNSNGTFDYFCSSDGNSWLFDINGTFTCSSNTSYFIKFGWDGTEYYLDVSTDGKSFIRDITQTSSSSIYGSLTNSYIGIYNMSQMNFPFLGSIDLSQFYIYKNGNIWWTPYQTNINIDSVTGVAQESIAINSQGEVLISGDAVTGSTVSATNMTETPVSDGDKVWINKVEDGYNIIDFSDITQNSLTATASTNMAAATKTLNVLDVDTAVNNNGVVSDLTKGLKTKTDITLYKNKSFEIGCKVTRGSNTSGYQEIFTSGDLFLIRAHDTTWSGVFWVNGSWRGYETGTASANTTYYTRVRYFPTATTDSGMSYSAYYIYFEVSTDNSSWSRIYSYDLSTNFIGSNPSATETTNNYRFGSQGTADELWKGSIDFNNTYFKVDGNVVWNGTTLIPGGTGDVYIGDIVEPTISRLEITPSTSSQTFDSNSVDGYKPVIVSGVTSSIDANIIPENIKKDITILGVIGTHEGGGSTINNQNKTVSAETSQKYVTFDSGYTGLGTVTINAVDSSIDNNIISGNIIEGKSILGVPGSAKAGASDYNFTIVGNSPTVDQNGILSGFSGEDHVKHLDYYHDTINSLEFLIKVKTPVEMGNISSQYICKQGFLTLLFTKNNDVPCFFTNGQSSNISLNTTYYIKATWDGSNYTVSYSTNNSSWTQMISREMTSNPYTSKFIFGNVVDETWHNTQPFAGEIDLANTYIKVNGSTYWTWKTMNYPLDISEDGFYVSDSRYTGIRSVNVHVLDGAAEMLAEIISGSGSVHTDESISE